MSFLAKPWLCSKLADKDGLFGHDRPVNGRPATNQVSAQFLGLEQEATTLLAAENHSLTVADDYAAFVYDASDLLHCSTCYTSCRATQSAKASRYSPFAFAISAKGRKRTFGALMNECSPSGGSRSSIND